MRHWLRSCGVVACRSKTWRLGVAVSGTGRHVLSCLRRWQQSDCLWVCCCCCCWRAASHTTRDTGWVVSLSISPLLNSFSPWWIVLHACIASALLCLRRTLNSLLLNVAPCFAPLARRNCFAALCIVMRRTQLNHGDLCLILSMCRLIRRHLSFQWVMGEIWCYIGL